MKQVHKSVLLPYSPQEMYDLVVDVAQYPAFLPWCPKGEVLEQRPDGMTARLHMAFAGVRHAFTTRNRHEPPHAVTLELVDGPFSMLHGHWQFKAIGPAATSGSDGAAAATTAATPAATPAAAPMKACRTNLDLRYAFSSRPLELLVSPVFDRIANTLVDGFVQRAAQVYGRR